MRLAEFITGNKEAILAEWEAFATTLLPAAANLTPLALRDDAPQILEAVAKDMAAPQTPQEQADKSKGWAPRMPSAPATAAETHALLRARSGFDIGQLAAEYRALRACVLRLWMSTRPQDASTHLDDVVRFNEAIDQAVAESVALFSAQVDQARNLLLGMLGHDMRSPLNTILTTASYLAALNAGEQVSSAASRLIRSGASMKALLDDLVDFNRTKLGLGINISPLSADLVTLVADELEQIRGAHPGRQIELEVAGDTEGLWDGPRLQQLLRNLVTNAFKYGASDAPVRVTVTGEGPEIRLEVTNRGPAIEQAVMDQIFDPLKRGTAHTDRPAADSGLGLGLYIVREVTRAHGGQVAASSGEGETVFAVRLPRRRQVT